jgi:hypothetical protein
MKTRTKLALLLAALSVFALGSAAWAAIPSGDSTIHACHDKTTGALRVTNPDTNTPKGCTAKGLDWYKGSPAADTFVARFGTDTATRLRRRCRAQSARSSSPPARKPRQA